jgi:4-amino-4-deoxy-L-arabinose transferase-like glycosyltransferase
MSEAQQVAEPPQTAGRHQQSGAAARNAPTRGDLLFASAAVLAGIWALFQNFYKIATAPVLADEPTYISAARRYLDGSIRPSLPTTASGYLRLTPDNFEHPPLVKYLFGLSQRLDGSPGSLGAVRAVSALAAVAAAVALAVWAGKLAGRWTGLLAGALLTVIPESASGSMGRFDRFAMLDPVASMFMVFSVLAAWVWAHRSGRAAWGYAAVTGLAVGCASGSKENGFLGAAGPVFLVIVLALVSRDRRAVLARCAQVAVAIAVSLVTFVCLYLPFSHPLARIRYLLDYQTAQSGHGHLIGFAGQVSTRPPWWANLWFAGHAYGPVLTAFLLIAVACAITLRRDMLSGWCVTALVGPFIFHCFIAGVTLGFYWVMWTPMVLTLAAVGAAEVIRLAARATRSAAVATVTGLAVLAVPATTSVAQSVTVAGFKPAGVEAVPHLMRANGLRGPVVSAGLPVWYWTYYMPHTRVYYSVTTRVPGAALVVMGRPQCRQLTDRSVRALVAANLVSGRIVKIYADSQIVAYKPAGALLVPTKAEINAQAPGNLADNC